MMKRLLSIETKCKDTHFFLKKRKGRDEKQSGMLKKGFLEFFLHWIVDNSRKFANLAVGKEGTKPQSILK